MPTSISPRRLAASFLVGLVSLGATCALAVSTSACTSSSSGGGDDDESGGGDQGGSGGAGGDQAGAGGAGGDDGGLAEAGGQGGAGGAACGDTTSDPQNCGACGHSCGGATCSSGRCQPTVLRTNFWHDSRFAVDATSLYTATSDAKVSKGPKTAGGTDAPIATLADRPAALLQNGASLLFCTGSYCDGSSAAIAVLSKSGGAPTTIGDAVSAFAADDANAYYLSGPNGQDGIFSVPLAGGTPHAVSNDATLGYYGLRRIYVHGAYLYVAALGYSGQGDAIFRLPKAGGNVQAAVENSSHTMVLAFSGTQMVGAYSSGDCSSGGKLKIWTAPETGGDETIIATQAAPLESMVADDHYVYWNQSCDGSVWRMPVSGGTPEEMWPGDGYDAGGDLAIDDGFVYAVSIQANTLLALPK